MFTLNGRTALVTGTATGLGKVPKGELATPEDVAAAVVFLASAEAGMINSATLPVDGGWSAW